jgi:small subunit ribosomal protein S21
MPVTVYAREGEGDKSLLNRFNKKVARSGILSDARNKRWFISKSEQRRLAKKKAIRRIQRKKEKRSRK